MDISKLSPCGQMNMKFISDGQKDYDNLIEMSKNPMEHNTNLLMQIIKDNKDTEYGRKYGFEGIKSVKDFQEKVPVSTYDDYAPYIYRMTEKGEKNLISAYDITHFAKSSGTMGNPKRIPVSTKAQEISQKYLYNLRSAILAKCAGTDWIDLPVFNLIESSVTKLKNGATYGAISANVILSLGDYLPLFFTSPIEALIPDIETNTRYVHSIFALMKKDITTIGFSFSSLLLEILRYIKSNWKILVEDIENGIINESIKMPAEVRESLSQKIKPMPERAQELREIFENHVDEQFIPLIWPNLSTIFGIGTGGFSNYLNKAKKEFMGNDIFCYYVGLSASEGFFTTPYELNNPNAILIPDSVFFEFLPLDCNDFSEIKTLDQVEVGKDYELVVTNLSGFYRYRMRDAVRVTGMFNGTPIIEFLYRIDQNISLLGEKTTEQMFRGSVTQTEEELDLNIVDFSIYGEEDSEPMKYVCLIEVEEIPDGINKKDIEFTLNKYLNSANSSLKQKIDKGFLDSTEIKFVQPETYLLYRDLMISKGASSAQLKPPRIITNEVHKRFFLVLLDEELNN